MRTLILVLASFILFLIFQTCREYNTQLLPPTPQIAKDSIDCSSEGCGPCCNNGYCINCNTCSDKWSLHYENPVQLTCITCECADGFGIIMGDNYRHPNRSLGG
jgi:hypothetical protein